MDLSSMKRHYNSFAEGGDIDPDNEHNNTSKEKGADFIWDPNGVLYKKPVKPTVQKTKTDVFIVNDRIENIKNQKYDVITSRAMSSLTSLLSYAEPYCKKNSICLFPKGKKYAEELAEAHKKWNFKCKIEQNEVSAEGRILIISDISKKKEKRNAKNFSRS